MKFETKNNELNIAELVKIFLTSFRSEHTKTAYENDLKQFFSFCASHLSETLNHPSQITEGICILWKHQQADLSNQTLARKIAVLSSFFKFCQRQKILITNPVLFMTRPKLIQTGKTNILTREEIDIILESAQIHMRFGEINQNDFQHKLWHKRYTILYTLFTVGMRVEELCQLKFEDLEKVDKDLYRLHLTVKGNQKHAPLIHLNTAQTLIEYMQARSISQKGQLIFEGMDRTSIYKLVQTTVKKANIEKKVSPHSFRASLATHLHKNGVPLGHIKDLLNHKNIATTLLYTRVSDEELQENANLLE